MNVTTSLAPLVSLIAGILILVVPRLLNYIVAIYLILIGLLVVGRLLRLLLVDHIFGPGRCCGFLLRLLDCVVESWVAGWVATADSSRHLDVLDQLGEELAAAGIDHSLFVLGRSPLGVTGHARNPNRPVTARPSVVSGARSARPVSCRP